ncbi:MAG: phage tail sheath C-terminal domain-containing protein [bacterium]
MPTINLPDVYTDEITPSGAPVKGVGTGVASLVGKFKQGDVNVNMLCGNWEQFVEKCGGLAIGSAAYDAYWFFKNKGSALQVVRVQGTAANFTIQDRQGTPADKLKVIALVDGVFANYVASPKTGVQIIIADGTITNTFKMTINYYYQEKGADAAYTETFDNLSIVSTAARYFPTIVNDEANGSKVIKVEDLAPSNETPPGHLPAIGTYDLASGVEPDYVGSGTPEGIDLLENVDEINILITDKDDSSTRTLQITHCQTLLDRQTVLNPPIYQTVTEAKAIGDAYDEDRAVLPYPWVVAYDPIMKVQRSFRPAGFRAGVMSRIDAYLSPCNHAVYGAIDLERQLSRADLVSLQESKISPTYWWGTRGIRIRNGLNCSSNENLSQVYRRRMADYVMESIEDSFGWAVALPINEKNRNALRSGITNWFRNLQLAGWIEGFFVKCDKENNPEEVEAARTCEVRYGVKLFNIMDFIKFKAEVGPNVIVTTEGGA